jgi:hypothetical protein
MKAKVCRFAYTLDFFLHATHSIFAQSSFSDKTSRSINNEVPFLVNIFIKAGSDWNNSE